eukprot:scaffold9573_cov30-Attheya_sp.AAC.1
MAHCSAASPQKPSSRLPNYKQIELLAVCAAGLDIYEKGGEKKLPVLHYMYAYEYASPKTMSNGGWDQQLDHLLDLMYYFLN